MRRAVSVALLAFVAASQPQDPQPQDPQPQDPQPQDPPAQNPDRPNPAGMQAPRAPEGAAPLPPIEDPPYSPVERDDLLQRFTPPSPLEGHYELRAFSRGTGAPIRATGYLAVGRQHLSMHLMSPAAAGGTALRAAYRRYRINGDQLVMTTLVGFGNDRADAGVEIEPAGATRVLRFSRIGTRLRLFTGGGRVLEFERIE
ncbi:MAG: hypothetical protein AAF628_36485 [Planctomycetota bacterium]